MKEIMRMYSKLFYVLLISLLFSVGDCHEHENKHQKKKFNLQRSNFPDDFVFGASSSAYQYEGAVSEDGRKPSIWDTFIQKYPDKILDKSSGAVAIDFYHRYKEDVGIMKQIGLNGFRFSISWPRVLPGGNLKSGVNKKGIDFYNNLIDELLSQGIAPFVTLFHWDLPQALQDEYGGFLNSKILNDFADFADLCYSNFGDRVKHWITLNEPASYATAGYTSGIGPPGRCSEYVSSNCTGGDSGTEPYTIVHNQLLAHAAAVRVYRQKYQKQQKGEIGIALNSEWIMPLTDTEKDKAAAHRALSFRLGCFMEPLESGKYPEEMVSRLKKRLPKFTEEESSMVKGSYDFIGINYYSSNYVYDIPCPTENLSFTTDSCATTTLVRNGVPIGPPGASEWLYAYPEGIFKLLRYTKKKYNNPVIYITENGFSDHRNDSLDDGIRVQYYKDHVFQLQKAIRKGVDLKGYFPWSLLDNFEWGDGYTVRFGIVYVDYDDGLKRSLKKSGEWYKMFLASSSGNITNGV